MKEYHYHVQRQAEDFAAGILPVPPDYPLKSGLPERFRDDFARLCSLAKSIYLDMAQWPEDYGLMLLEIGETNHNLARNSYRTVHRLVDTLNALCLCGEVVNHVLNVNAKRFKATVRGNPAVSKYAHILNKLGDFGFAISDFNGSALSAKAERFTVEYPDDPILVDTLKSYCDYWQELDQFRIRGKASASRKDSPLRNQLIKLSPQEFHHHFYRFDYKVTADLEHIPMQTWLQDEALYQGYGEELTAFSDLFFQSVVKYEGMGFDGEYHCRGKRVARITCTNFTALEKARFALSLKLRKMDRYADYIAVLPEKIKAVFARSNCGYCTSRDGVVQPCKYRLNWTLEGKNHAGCAYACFLFDDFSPEALPHYCKLLELEYEMKKV
ncbi:MAG: hypothetical protein ACK5LX_09395 [Oscillospiraceae bacterium]